MAQVPEGTFSFLSTVIDWPFETDLAVFQKAAISFQTFKETIEAQVLPWPSLSVASLCCAGGPSAGEVVVDPHTGETVKLVCTDLSTHSGKHRVELSGGEIVEWSG